MQRKEKKLPQREGGSRATKNSKIGKETIEAAIKVGRQSKRKIVRKRKSGGGKSKRQDAQKESTKVQMNLGKSILNRHAAHKQRQYPPSGKSTAEEREEQLRG